MRAKTKDKSDGAKGRIANQIRGQIGSSVLIVYILVEVLIVVIVTQTVYDSKKTQLTLESEASSNQLAGIF